MLVHFAKMECLGQDFMVLDAVTEKLFVTDEKIRKWADRYRGIGFSTLALVEPPYDPDVDFQFRFFNSDGSEIPSSSHGAMVLGAFVKEKYLTNKPEILVGIGPSLAKINISDPVNVVLKRELPIFEPSEIGFRAPKKENTYIIQLEKRVLLSSVAAIDTPHCITDNFFNENSLDSIGNDLISSNRFSISPVLDSTCRVDEHTVKLRTWNKFYGEVSSSGTSSILSATVGILQKKLKTPVTVTSRGGTEIVSVDYQKGIVSLKSQVNYVYSGTINI